MKFLAHSKNGLMLKMEDTTNPKGYEWYFIAPDLMEFAKTIEKEADLNLKIENKNQGLTITAMQIIKKGEVVNDFKPKDVEFKCAKCGAKLKDDTYKTCYTCSMELRNQLANSPEEKEKQEVSKRQTVAHAVSRALIALQGHVDPNNINAFIDSLATKFKEIVG